MKHGEGKFLYLDKGQVYSGLWYNDIAKCGTLEDYGRDIATNKPIYPIPEVQLYDDNKSICIFLMIIIVLW
jgi:hypothetical protein